MFSLTYADFCNSTKIFLPLLNFSWLMWEWDEVMDSLNMQGLPVSVSVVLVLPSSLLSSFDFTEADSHWRLMKLPVNMILAQPSLYYTSQLHICFGSSVMQLRFCKCLPPFLLVFPSHGIWWTYIVILLHNIWKLIHISVGWFRTDLCVQRKWLYVLCSCFRLSF